MRTMRALQVLGFSFLLVAAAGAQEHRPLSPRGTASTQVGGKWVTESNGEMSYTGGKWIDIDYGRPILRGRTDIFGSGADYGKPVYAGGPLWRIGANVTTRLHTEVALKLGEATVPAGDYSLFADLTGGKWTLIVSRQPFQEKYDPKNKEATWGAYGYDAKYDVVRVPMKVGKIDDSVDQLTLGFQNMTAAGGELAICWGHTRASVDFSTAP